MFKSRKISQWFPTVPFIQTTGKQRKWGEGGDTNKININKRNGSCYKGLGRKIIRITSYFWLKCCLCGFSCSLLLILTESSSIHPCMGVSTPQSLAPPHHRGPANSTCSLPTAAPRTAGTGDRNSYYAALITTQPHLPPCCQLVSRLFIHNPSQRSLCPNWAF